MATALRASARPLGSVIQGAPTTSNGVAVSRPTERFVASRSPTPAYRSAPVSERMFGEGLTQGSPVWSNHMLRFQCSSDTTVSLTGIFRSPATILANSPRVIPLRTGTSAPRGLGRSRTMTGLPAIAQALMHSAMCQM